MAKIYNILILSFLCLSVVAMEEEEQPPNPLYYKQAKEKLSEIPPNSSLSPDLRRILLMGDVNAFEKQRKNLKKYNNKKFVTDANKYELSSYANKGGYKLWAEGFEEGYNKIWRWQFLNKVIRKSLKLNSFKHALFFSAKWGDFFSANQAIKKWDARNKKYEAYIVNEDEKPAYEIAHTNGYLQFADYLKRGGFLSKDWNEQEIEKKRIINEILEINRKHLANGITENEANLLSLNVVMNSSDLANSKYPDTVFDWLAKQNFPVKVKKIGKEKGFMELSFDDGVWELVSREILLKNKESFEREVMKSTLDKDLLATVSKSIAEDRFLQECKWFWDYKKLIDQGLPLEYKFKLNEKGKNGMWTLSELAADMGQTVLALAFHNKILWELFDKQKLFEHVTFMGFILIRQQQMAEFIKE